MAKIRMLGLAIGLGVLLAAAGAHAASEPGPACVAKKAKAAGKKAFDLSKAFGKNIKKPNEAKLGADISKAQSKFTKSFTKEESKGGCETSGDSDEIETKVDDFVAQSIAEINGPSCGDNFINQPGEECDGTDDSLCQGLCTPNCLCPDPECGNGVLEAGEECDSPCAQGTCGAGETCIGTCVCAPVAACACGSPPPEELRFTTLPGVGTCGTTKDATGDNVLDLDCAGLYIGAGGGDLSVPAFVPDNGTNFYDVECCNGTNITLGALSSTETGSSRTCTEESVCDGSSTNPGTECAKDADCPGGACDVCYFGGPLPNIRRGGNIFLSTCLINVMSADGRGQVDCTTGDATTKLNLNTDVFLRGIDLSDEDGWQSCPVCVGGTLGAAGSGTCEGGANDGGSCTPENTQLDLHDCCDATVSGTNGKECDDDSDCGGGTCVSGCSAFPTSHDCPLESIFSIGFIPVPFPLSSGTSQKVADAEGNFCGFCRDVNIEGSTCFEGDPDPISSVNKGCPPSATVACDPSGTCVGGSNDGGFCQRVCPGPTCECPGGGTCEQLGDTSDCGDAVPCRTDADCTAPYETCEQRNPGAFRNQAITEITETGVPGGDLTGRTTKAATNSSVFCIQPSFTPNIDASADLGGPGAVSLYGETQLLPTP